MVQVFKIRDGQATEPYLVVGTDAVDALNALVDQKIIANHYSIQRVECIGKGMPVWISTMAVNEAYPKDNGDADNSLE